MRMSVWMAGVVLVVGTRLAWGSTNVAVVNVPMVSEKYHKTTDLEAQFDAVRRKLNQERDAMKEKIDRANRSLQEEIKPGTEEFRQRRKEIALMEAELQWFIESEGQKVEKGLAESLRSIFGDIQAVVREVAEEKGIDVVMASDHLPPDTPEAPQQVRQHILLQKVLYWHARVDITEDVVTRLNTRYKAAGGASLPASVATPVPDPAPPKSKEPAPPPGSKKP